jgi:hypothetical protein
MAERESITLLLDHAFGVEFTDLGFGCNRDTPPLPTC